jgi:hypothetical protein
MKSKVKLLAPLLAAALVLALLAAAPAGAAFGLKGLAAEFEEEGGAPATQAGSHPLALTTKLEVETREDPKIGLVPDGAVKDLRIEFPAGMVGNPTAVPQCTSADFAALKGGGSSCPDASAVGVAELEIGLGFEGSNFQKVAVFNLVPPPGVAAKIGFVVLNVPVTAELGVNPDPPYNVIATLSNISQAVRFYGSTVRVWGNPASPIHDSERGNVCGHSGGSCPVSLPEKPFLTLPRSCQGPTASRFSADSWQQPGAFVSYLVQSPFGMSGCGSLGFAPEVSSEATTRQAASSTGLTFTIDVNDPGLISPAGVAKSDIKKAVVTLPEGVTVNPSVAEGLATCSEAELATTTAFSAPGEGCPQASKVGEVEVETPLLEGKLLHGSIFVATQDENPFDSMLALYMVIQDPETGIVVKLPGRVDPDPRTGQLTTTFGEAPYEIPQFPFSHFRFRFREGARAPLITPSVCGTHQTKVVFTPWANPASTYTTTASFDIDHGPNGGPCPSGLPGFQPGFLAGSRSNAAGRYSAFDMRLTRADGEQEMTRFDSVLPPGLSGKIAGVGKCPEAAIAAAKAKSGREELAFPSCPADSKIGSSLAGAGVGNALTYVPGSIYLAGPFGGDPLSIVAVTPAVAGPFDAGTVVVREALTLNRVTGEVEVDGGASDPIPHILKGIPLSLRDLRIAIDRPEFTRNPTSCAEQQARATLFGSGADLFGSGDDNPAQLASRFQASSCASLEFKPRLSLQLKGGIRRGAYPALTATVRPRPGDANIAKAVVTLPHSAFLAQEHINTVCTRVQFAANNCPAGSIYGEATARTPLLDDPLSGPVYLRSSSHKLPDLVVALHGLVDIDLVGRIDSVNARIRSNFETVPDQPVSSFTLKMKGGKKGLVVNSENLCASHQRAQGLFTGQNGQRATLRPLVRSAGCGGKKKRGR